MRQSVKTFLDSNFLKKYSGKASELESMLRKETDLEERTVLRYYIQRLKQLSE